MKAFNLNSQEQLREHLARSYVLYQPQQTADNTVRWVKDDGGAFDGTLPKPQISAKALFFAEKECLFRFDGKNFTAQVPKPEPQVLFGAYACDLAAIAYQDQFFQDDAHYQSRRQATLLVGVNCLSACDGGLCPTVDSGPAVREGTADLVMVEGCGDNGGWLLLSMSANGEGAVLDLALPPADAAWEERCREAEQRALQSFPDDGVLRQGIERIQAGQVPAELWDALGLQCLSCSGCTNVCPTCSCFTTYDRPLENGMERFRCWDSCLFEGFQKEAAGHNPSIDPGKRVERFWYHKFASDFSAEFGRAGCVGCGRCETVCPGVIGIHSVMQRIHAQ